MLHSLAKRYPIPPVKASQTDKRICYGGKTNKTCRIWLSRDKIHLL